jgi:hypothetical protein
VLRADCAERQLQKGSRAVIPREGGVSSTRRRFDSITGTSEYWIAGSSRAMTCEGEAHSLSRHCERSEAIHFAARRGERWIASSQTFLAMTSFRIPAARCARGVREFSPFENRGRRESRVPNAPAARVRSKKHTSVVTTGPPELVPASPAQWFYGFLRALPVTGLVCHRRLHGLLRET